MFSTYPSFVENFFKTLKQLRFQGWTFLRFQVKGRYLLCLLKTAILNLSTGSNRAGLFYIKTKSHPSKRCDFWLFKTINRWSPNQVVISHNTIANDTQFISPDDGGCTHLWNVSLLLRDYTAPYPRRLSSSYSPPREPEISQRWFGIASSNLGKGYFTNFSVLWERSCHGRFLQHIASVTVSLNKYLICSRGSQ
jgi:hypothetical protein